MSASPATPVVMGKIVVELNTPTSAATAAALSPPPLHTPVKTMFHEEKRPSGLRIVRCPVETRGTQRVRLLAGLTTAWGRENRPAAHIPNLSLFVEEKRDSGLRILRVPVETRGTHHLAVISRCLSKAWR
jgi:hypothetical protein